MKPTIPASVEPAGIKNERMRLEREQQVRDVLNFEGRRKAELATSAAGLTEIWSEEMPANAVWRIEASFVGRSTDGLQRCVFVRRGQFERVEGDAAILGSLDAIGTDYESDAALDVDISASGAYVKAYVNGSTHSMDWTMRASILEIR